MFPPCHRLLAGQILRGLTGTYTRIKHRKDENQSAILEVTQISGHRIRFDLTALWWPVGRGDSTHNGEITATVALRGRSAVYESEGYRLTMWFRGRTVVVTESGSNPDFGVNVSAAGTYRQGSSHHGTTPSSSK